METGKNHVAYELLVERANRLAKKHPEHKETKTARLTAVWAGAGFERRFSDIAKDLLMERDALRALIIGDKPGQLAEGLAIEIENMDLPREEARA